MLISHYSTRLVMTAREVFDYLPTVQKMIDSMQITSQGNGSYGMTVGPNGTMSITSGNISATLTAPPGSKVNNFTIIPEGNTSYAYPPPTITYSWEPGNNPDCSNCY